ncbi:MAG: 2-hydroxychromene-2-carboxylate isomerase [Hyphomonas sp.]|uniref:DsbA family protein n=1 Tax=Hyphomonas sp. TaxID=87 RepID=UPI00180A2290|nr:DsbA family protein [Hyphomonas sp.]MBU3921676.1 DsbA family protein [Alphaproteobacteria bacterium]MBA3069953.1 2-hydroxychromene-2-carboxylate isomerase [Hyphomonas sp.]MBU4060471.1 DsbA family protein [Alphaproteobacteria bacterium]MBU4163139.1 DsbA family protein [Alphaproteobacteria bacterium]MBU4569092.1 DsbA family protein [Alphaproteobacteria bacterium]
MSLKTLLVSRVAASITSEKRLKRKRVMQEKIRQAASTPHVVDYFHDVTDPYSNLCVQVLPAFLSRYDVSLQVHLVSPAPDWAAPERGRLEAYAREDAQLLAARAGLAFADPGQQPAPEHIQRANARLAEAIDAGTFVSDAPAISDAAWRGTLEGTSGDAGALSARLAAGSARREELGHYLGGTFHYGGEWYWGVDRLHYLEARLTELGARKPDTGDAVIFAPPVSPAGRAVGPASSPKPELHYYLSFRSPYTYIVALRAKTLADAYGADLKLRFVLPMIMRGLPVPRMKSRYITLDTAREARRLGVPFGKIADPVGKPVERGYSILPWARDQGRGFEFCHAFLSGVWSQGIDAGSDTGMRQIVEAAGLDWEQARQQLLTDDWRAEAEANRAEMMALGVWGVPSFRVGDVITWGQDRLWLIEDELRKQTS